MLYSSLQVKFEGTKPNGRIQRYGASIFGDTIIKLSKYLQTCTYIADNQAK